MNTVFSATVPALQLLYMILNGTVLKAISRLRKTSYSWGLVIKRTKQGGP